MVHQYKLAGRHIVVDTNSGSLHQVDELAYDVIARYESHTAEEIVETLLPLYGHMPGIDRDEILAVLRDVETLKTSAQLFTPEPGGALLAEAKKKRLGEVKALCLHVAHSCNLACGYCFAREGEYRGGKALMSFEVGKQALDFLLEQSAARKNLEVDFFGGEPLLNWDVVKALVAYGRSQEEKWKKRFRFTLTTNGMLLDEEVMDFSMGEMDTVVLSLDGRREVHDRFRKTPQGAGSYDVLLPKYQEFVARRGQKGYYIRATFTRRNLDFTEDILHMRDLGFTELSMEPVVAPPDDSLALQKADLPAIFAQYERLAMEMAKRRGTEGEFRFYHYTLDLDQGPCLHKRLLGCGSGTEYLAVTPWGDLYPCHQFVGEPSYVMGDVWQGVQNTEIRDEMAKCRLYTREACENCWAKLYCGGGCAANAYHLSGSLDGIDEIGCILFKKRLECAIFLKVAAFADDKKPQENAETEIA